MAHTGAQLSGSGAQLSGSGVQLSGSGAQLSAISAYLHTSYLGAQLSASRKLVGTLPEMVQLNNRAKGFDSIMLQSARGRVYFFDRL